MSSSSSAKSASRVATLDELLARCTVAKEQRLSESACVQAEQIVYVLGLPFPGDATNAELEGLLPLYTELLKDLRDNEDSPFMDILDDATRSPDAAIVLLYFLEFPNLVRTVRGSTSNISECNVDEQFGCADLVEEIGKTSSIINWCRGALSSSGEHHSVVLASCISILDSINRLPRQKAKKYIKRNVLAVKKHGSRADIIKQFKLLRSDLADTVLKEDVTKDASANAILYQMHTLVNLFGEDGAMEVMETLPRKGDFEKGLSKHRESFGNDQYQLFRAMLMLENQSIEELLAGGQVTREREPLGEFIGCARDGCSNPGTKSCSRCKIVRYCCRDCQLADWKAGHKKACKKSAHTKSPSEEAVRNARSMASPALRSQDEFLQSNPHIDYRIVLPSGSQDVGVMFPHPIGKSMFKMWRSQAPEPPYVYRMYEMLVENNPGRENIIRKQLRAEYGVDPISDEAKRTTAGTMPTGQQMVDSLSPHMIFYPEKPLKPGYVPSGASVRGTVGHNSMFIIPLNIYEGRIQKMWTQQAQSGRYSVLFGEHAPILLALLDGGIAQNLNETHRAESTTLIANEKLLKSQFTDLKRRIKGGGESFIFIPLETFYCNFEHRTMKSFISAALMGQNELVEKIMQAYSGATFWTHKKGPHPPDGSRPPDSDLVGPHEFNAGLRLQCGMSSALAIMLISMLLKPAKGAPNSDTFIFPHALVFSSSDEDGEKLFSRFVQHFGAFTQTFFKDWIKTWCTSGKECAAPRYNDDVVSNHVGSDDFIERVKKVGCSWYPLFSDDPGSTL